MPSAPDASTRVDASTFDASTRVDASTRDAGVAAPPPDTDVVGYAGGDANERLLSSVRLSDGTILVGGTAPDLAWLPPSIPRVAWPAPPVDAHATGHVAFVLHVAADLSAVLRVAHFPPDTVRDVLRLRTTEVPGAPTGAVYISGSRDAADVMTDGYYIARLDGNFVDAVPSGVAWARDVRARPRRASGFTGESHYKTAQPWDVGADGRVVYGSGAEYDYDWAQIGAFAADGTDAVVEHWPVHWTASGELRHVAASSAPEPVLRSGVVLKAGRGGSLRSHAEADFAVVGPDGNGRTDRPGRWPDDLYFSGPCLDGGARCAGGPGHTGYRTSDKPTQRLGGVVVDRHTGRMFFGYSTQSVLPDGGPDFEPAVVAMDAEGRLLWWSRLYPEAGVSTPDQYVDGLAFDPASDTVVVLARAHGNNTVHFWNGDEVAAAPTQRGFQASFTGTEGNIHVSWLGRFGAADGVLRAATWVAELSEALSGGVAPFGAETPTLEGQPNPNAGWPNLNTTRCRSDVAIDGAGRVYVACTGRRTITTRDGFQRMPDVGGGVGSWNDFVRVYSADLGSVVYSSLLTGVWDSARGEGGGNTTLRLVLPVEGGLYTVGWSAVDADGTTASGAPIPTASLRGILRAAPTSEDGILAFLRVP